jgi:hypothetical protein
MCLSQFNASADDASRLRMTDQIDHVAAQTTENSQTFLALDAKAKPIRDSVSCWTTHVT